MASRVSSAKPGPAGPDRPTGGVGALAPEPAADGRAGGSASGLLGREQPLAVLRGELHRTRTSHGSLALVTGEAGIGKSRLVSHLAQEAAAAGALVVSGAAWEAEHAPGYWPWVQVLRALRRAATAVEWADGQAAAGAERLSVLLGEAGRPAAAHELTEETAFALHDAVATLLVTVSRSRPVVVVLEDLHYADAASTRLLEFVVGHTWFERVLIVATYRDVAVEHADGPAGRALRRLSGRATTVTLTGLRPDGVGALLATALGEAPDPETVAAVHRRTGGNPFFVEQVVRLRAAGGDAGAVPPGIREAVDSRLSSVPPAVRELLTAASVIGPEFDSELLAAATGASPEELTPVLAQAVAARLLVRHGCGSDRELRYGFSSGDGCYGFVHDLVREVRYGALPAAERRKRHAAVVAALARLPDVEQRTRWGSLAHHAGLAVPEVAPEQAQEYLLAAARFASERMAVEEAARHLRRALSLVPDDQPGRRAALTVDLAGFQAAAGELVEARAALREAAELARRLPDARLLGRAALGLHQLGTPPECAASELELVDEARAALAAAGVPDGEPLAVRLLAAAARARVHTAFDEPTLAQARELSARAVALARAGGDPAVLGFALLARHDAVWRPGTAPERLAIADELLAVGQRSGEWEAELQGSLLRMVALLELGDPAALTEHAALSARAERFGLRRWRFHARSRRGAVATLTGAFDEAAAAIDQAAAMAEQMGEVDRRVLWREQRWLLALLRGDFKEAAELFAAADSELDAELARAVTDAHRGRAAAGSLGLAAASALADGHPPMFASAYLRDQAQIAAAAGDPELCRQAREALAPLSELWLVVAGGGVVHGPVRYWLAELDAAEQRFDAAVAGYTAAWRAADRLRARPWSLAARYGLACALRARAAGSDTARASELLREVAAGATELGMRHLAERAHSGVGHAADPGGAGGGVPAEPEQPAELRFDGRVWTLTYAGRTVHLPPAKGLRDLQLLVSRPGVDVPATELLDPAGGDTVRAQGRLGADAVLDERARAEYRRRLTRLDEEIDRAVDRHDDARAAELDREREALLQELRSAAGLGGRPRRLGDQGERARKTVTARIRDSLRRIDAHHPELAEHLRAAVTTGITCRYQPARRVTWRL